MEILLIVLIVLVLAALVLLALLWRRDSTARLALGLESSLALLRADLDRVERNIRIITEANNLPRLPSIGEVIDRRFLPPEAERVKKF